MTFKEFKKTHQGRYYVIAGEDIPGFYKVGSSIYGDCEDMIVADFLYDSFNEVYTVYLKNAE